MSSVDPGPCQVNRNTDVAGAKRVGQIGQIPDHMLAIDPAGPGGADVLVLVSRPVPQPGTGEVLIRVAAAGVNRPDILQRRGLYPPPPGAPTIPGLEVSGEIVACGPGVESELKGSAVCALVPGGGYAEYVVAHADICLPVPETLSMVEAAGLPETLFTVWTNLFHRAHARDGESILVHGGTSGIGTMAIALGEAFGLKVIVTCGSDEKCRRAEALGAALAINYRDQDFVEEVKQVTGGKGVDIVVDMVGGDYLGRNLDCLAEEGRHVSIAVQRGAAAELNIAKVMQRRLTLTGSTLRPRSSAYKGVIADDLAKNVWPLVEQGRLRPVIHATYPLAEAGKAHEMMEAGEHVGKIILTV